MPCFVVHNHIHVNTKQYTIQEVNTHIVSYHKNSIKIVLKYKILTCQVHSADQGVLQVKDQWLRAAADTRTHHLDLRQTQPCIMDRVREV